ncbi:MAG: MotA/TolQ/ExbB proton channel family protein [Chlamydiales bacterium]|nr:MotA/TolQ/ExbB proton channel family protein [Chlamydiales bacterium]
MAAHPFLTAFQTADGFGKCIFLALFTLSILSWFVLLHKLWLLRKVKETSNHFSSFIAQHQETLLHLKSSHMPTPSSSVPQPFTKIYLTLKKKTNDLLAKNQFFMKKGKNDPVHLSRADLAVIKSDMQTAIKSAVKQLEHNLFILSTVVTLAPFLGLLGTVWGILVAFSELQSGASIGSSTALLGGLSTALTTTVIGLIIAIPALVAHSYFKNVIRQFAGSMEIFGSQLIEQIELQYRQVDVT